MEKQLLFIFGKTGAGKDYVARIFAEEYGYHRYDADIDLTPEMVYAVKHQLEFTAEMRNRYLEIVKRRIHDLLQVKEKIVITQGLFKNVNRHNLMKEFPSAGWIWVDAEQSIIDERVYKRNSLVTIEYARKINRYFEKPDFACYKILNNRDQVEVINQVLIIGRELSKEGNTNAAK